MTMAMIESDGRPSTASDTTERPSMVVARPACAICGRPVGRRVRRGCCQACDRKFREHGLPMPPASAPGPRARDPLLYVIDRMTEAQRTKALIYLGQLAAREPKP